MKPTKANQIFLRLTYSASILVVRKPIVPAIVRDIPIPVRARPLLVPVPVVLALTLALGLSAKLLLLTITAVAIVVVCLIRLRLARLVTLGVVGSVIIVALLIGLPV